MDQITFAAVHAMRLKHAGQRLPPRSHKAVKDHYADHKLSVSQHRTELAGGERPWCFSDRILAFFHERPLGEAFSCATLCRVMGIRNDRLVIDALHNLVERGGLLCIDNRYVLSR
jgi:hypothetical protein